VTLVHDVAKVSWLCQYKSLSLCLKLAFVATLLLVGIITPLQQGKQGGTLLLDTLVVVVVTRNAEGGEIMWAAFIFKNLAKPNLIQFCLFFLYSFSLFITAAVHAFHTTIQAGHDACPIRSNVNANRGENSIHHVIAIALPVWIFSFHLCMRHVMLFVRLHK